MKVTTPQILENIFQSSKRIDKLFPNFLAPKRRLCTQYMGTTNNDVLTIILAEAWRKSLEPAMPAFVLHGFEISIEQMLIVRKKLQPYNFQVHLDSLFKHCNKPGWQTFYGCQLLFLLNFLCENSNKKSCCLKLQFCKTRHSCDGFALSNAADECWLDTYFSKNIKKIIITH